MIAFCHIERIYGKRFIRIDDDESVSESEFANGLRQLPF